MICPQPFQLEMRTRAKTRVSPEPAVQEGSLPAQYSRGVKATGRALPLSVEGGRGRVTLSVSGVRPLQGGDVELLHCIIASIALDFALSGR